MKKLAWFGMWGAATVLAVVVVSVSISRYYLAARATNTLVSLRLVHGTNCLAARLPGGRYLVCVSSNALDTDLAGVLGGGWMKSVAIAVQSDDELLLQTSNVTKAAFSVPGNRYVRVELSICASLGTNGPAFATVRRCL